MSARKPRLAPQMPTIFEIGKQIVALGDAHDAYDTKTLDRGLPFQQRHAIDKAKSIVWDQTEALVDLGLAMVPETVPDVVAQLVLADRRLDWLIACDMDPAEMKAIASDVLHVIRASLPVVAGAAQVDLHEVLGDGGHDFIDAERPKVEAVE